MFNLNKTAQTTIEALISEDLIPSKGNFEVTENLLTQYRIKYRSLLNRDNWLETSQVYSRKLAGFSLLQIKRDRGIPLKETKEGFLYFISNPAWPNKVKIGVTGDFNRRLASYQTYDPYRAYKLEGWDFVISKREAEKLLLNKFKLESDKGEWVTHKERDELVSYLRDLIDAESLDLDTRGNLKIGDIVYFNLPKEFRLTGKITKFNKNNRLTVQRVKPNNGKVTYHTIDEAQLTSKKTRQRYINNFGVVS